MKTRFLSLAFLAALAVPAFAGPPPSAPTQPVTESYSLYRAGELQIDAFGAFGFTGSGNDALLGDDVYGGGIGINYYFTRWLGIGVEGLLFDTEGDMLGTSAVSILFRAPLGDSGFALYAFGGAGLTFNADDLDSDDFDDARDRAEDGDDARDGDDVLFLAHVGGGVEYRFNPNLSIFSDARYTWVESDDSDFGMVRAGLRFVF